MKVLLFNGSPHEKGCTFTALEEIAKTLKEEGIDSEIYQIGTGAITPCRGCGACRKLGKCVVNDDGVFGVYSHETADLASMTYYGLFALQHRGQESAGIVVNDDGVNAFVDYAADFDGFVFGSPVHYASASGAITAFLDKVFVSAFASGRGDIFRHKPGATIPQFRALSQPPTKS